MKSPTGRWARRLAAGAAVAAALAWAGSAGAAGFALSLDDPRSGKTVGVEPGARVLHVVFFATWCPPCLAELDALADLEARWGDRGYRLVVVAVQNRHTVERLAKFVAERSPPGELLFDARGQARRALSADDLPTHVLFIAAGKELQRSGALDGEVRAVLESALRPGARRPGP